MADSEYPRGGGTKPKGGANLLFGQFFQKLHQNEEILCQRRGEGARPSLPLDPPLIIDLVVIPFVGIGRFRCWWGGRNHDCHSQYLLNSQHTCTKEVIPVNCHWSQVNMDKLVFNKIISFPSKLTCLGNKLKIRLQNCEQQTISLVFYRMRHKGMCGETELIKLSPSEERCM